MLIYPLKSTYKQNIKQNIIEWRVRFLATVLGYVAISTQVCVSNRCLTDKMAEGFGVDEHSIQHLSEVFCVWATIDAMLRACINMNVKVYVFMQMMLTPTSLCFMPLVKHSASNPWINPEWLMKYQHRYSHHMPLTCSFLSLSPLRLQEVVYLHFLSTRPAYQSTYSMCCLSLHHPSWALDVCHQTACACACVHWTEGNKRENKKERERVGERYALDSFSRMCT